jgi:regulator of protease activity HflC (stomatin/prohibitin superfamily)
VVHGRIIGVIVIAIMCVSVAVGCGGEGDASAEITKAEFTKEAEAICKERKKDWDTALASFNKKAAEKPEGDFQKFIDQTEAYFDTSLIPLLAEELGALEALDVPEADEAEIEKMLRSRSRGIKELEKGGTETLLGNPFKGFEKEAKAYGLNCPPLL